MAYKIVKKKRRREGKTDYRKRFLLLKSGLPRLVVRKTNKYIVAQIVKSKEAQDFVVCDTNSKELLKYEWPIDASGSLKSIPAAYLTGILLAKKLNKSKMNKEKIILDTGLQRSTKGGRIYAVVKGMLDCKINVLCSKDILPSMERVEGKNLKKKINLEEIKKNIER